MVPVHPDELRAVWPDLEPWFLRIIDGMNGRHTLQSLLGQVMDQEVIIWAVVGGGAVKAVVGTEIAEAPSGLRSLIIRFMAGESMKEWLHLLDDLEEFARQNQCHRIETWASKGFARHLSDYKMTHVLLEKDI